MDVEKSYNEALDYLYSYIDYSLTRTFRYTADKFDLGRVHAFLEYLDNPHKKYRVIHVAGTKGKGSTCALMASALQQGGYRVGFYSSPHLEEFTERIKVNNEEISKRSVVELVDHMKPYVDKIERLTTFELMTALGFLYFANQAVEVAVVEVGMGGRLDATNVVDPLITVITSVSFDHTQVLGDTLAKIAAEKAGIIKPGRPLVLAPQKEEARLVIARIAEERGAPLIQVGEDVLFAPGTHSLSGQSMLVWSADEQQRVVDYIESGGRHTWEPLRLTIPLLGHHQVENAATGYVALQAAREEGLSLSEVDLQKGFANVDWPARFEVLQRSPLVIIDSAHNRDSALKLRLAISDYIPDKPVILIFGASEDKDVNGMFSVLLPRVQQVIATESTHPRAMASEEIVAIAHRFGRPARVINPVDEALKQAIEAAGQDAVVIATGSIFVAAAVREMWHKLYKDKNSPTE